MLGLNLSAIKSAHFFFCLSAISGWWKKWKKVYPIFLIICVVFIVLSLPRVAFQSLDPSSVLQFLHSLYSFFHRACWSSAFWPYFFTNFVWSFRWFPNTLRKYDSELHHTGQRINELENGPSSNRELFPMKNEEIILSKWTRTNSSTNQRPDYRWSKFL